MSVTLDQILTLAGRLDDAPGFDSPRERFRRFLLEHVGDLKTARTFIEQCQHSPGDQHHRALQDLVALLGRFIGFEGTFASHLPAAGGLPDHGCWRSPSRLLVVLEVKSDQAAGADLDGLLRSASGLKAAGTAPPVPVVGLCVLTPLGVSAYKLAEAIAAAASAVPIGFVTLRALLSLAGMVGVGRVTHEEVVRLLESNIALDFIVELLDRSAGAQGVERPPDASGSVHPGFEKQGFWIATVTPEHGATAEEFLEEVVGRRQVFEINESGTLPSPVRSGDWICFHISGKGVVGRARVASLGEGGGIRTPYRFRQLLHLEDIALHLGSPIAPDFETQLRWRTAPWGANRRTQTLVEISRDSFAALTPRRETPPKLAVSALEPAAAEPSGIASAPVGPGETKRPKARTSSGVKG